MKKEELCEILKIDYYAKRGKKRPGREHSIFHLKGAEDFDDSYPDWFYDSRETLKGFCLYCQKKLPNKRKKYCSESCKRKCYGCHNAYQGTSVRKFIHKVFKFQCNNCETYFREITPAGFHIPQAWGEIDHIVPLWEGGTDDAYNLQLLCCDCHKKKTLKEQKRRNELKRSKS